MDTLVIALSIALVLTTIYAFRFRAWRRPRLLAVYFCALFTLEVIVDHFLLPPGALAIELGYVCLAVTALFAGAIYIADRHDRGRPDGG